MNELIKFANSTLDYIAGGEVDDLTLKRWEYGGTNIGQFGNFRRCNNLEESRYVMFYQEVLDGPLTIYTAFCLPKACSESDYESVLN